MRIDTSAILAPFHAVESWAYERSAPLQTTAIGLLLLGLYQWQMYRNGVVFGAVFVLGAAAFIATLMLPEIGIAAIVLSMLLSPEIKLAPAGLHGLTVRLEDLLIPVVAFAWLTRKTVGADDRAMLHDPIFYAMGTFTGLQILASFIGWGVLNLDIRTAILYVVKQLQYFGIFFFAFQYANSIRRRRLLLGFGLVTAAVTAAYNLALIPANQVWTRHRISAPFEGSPEPSSIGGYFVLVLGILLAFALKAPTARIRNWVLFFFALIFVPFLYTLSRTSYVAFLFLLLVLAALTRNRTLIALIVVGALFSPLLMPSSVISRIAYTFQDTSGVLGVDRSFGERLFIWYKVYWNMRDDPWLGKGVTYHNVIDSYFARVLIETGLFGLAAFLAIIARLFVLAQRVRTRHPQWWARALGLGYTAVLLALLVHSFSAVTFLIVRIMEPFWLLSGILASLALEVPPVEQPMTDPKAATAEPAPSPETPALAALTRTPPRRAFHHG